MYSVSPAGARSSALSGQGRWPLAASCTRASCSSRSPWSRIGKPADYFVNTVSERWIKDYRLWVVRVNDGIIALSGKCTHLGCTPRWLEAENKFKCPCHGSGFRGIDPAQGAPNIAGINFEGPAPRPLERFKIGLAEDGQIVVDRAIVYRGEFTDPSKNWLAPDSVLKV